LSSRGRERPAASVGEVASVCLSEEPIVIDSHHLCRPAEGRRGNIRPEIIRVIMICIPIKSVNSFF
jgi:hypothetical protein